MDKKDAAPVHQEVVERQKTPFDGYAQTTSSDCRIVALIAKGEFAAEVKPGANIEIDTPVIGIKKDEIVRKGVELGAPLDRTWSCYQDEEIACGVCDSCALRLRGFQKAGIPDPIPYRSRPSY